MEAFVKVYYCRCVWAVAWARRREEYVSQLEASVRRLVEVACAWPAVERVILFGSYARGRRDLLTDLDVVVVLRSELPFLDRQELVYRMFTLPVDADILCYTTREWEALRDAPFVQAILREGVVLYEKEPPRGGATVA